MGERRCEVCNAILVQRANEQNCKFRKRQLCSRACVVARSGKVRAERAQLPDRFCSTCAVLLVRRPNEDFSNWSRRTTCGMAECISGAIGKRLRGQDNGERRHCKACGALIVRREGEAHCSYLKRVTCGVGCRGLVSKMRSAEVDHVRTCESCGCTFTPRSNEPIGKFNRRRCCGRACRSALTAKSLFIDRGVKKCETCGVQFARREKNESSAQWMVRRYCSHACFAARPDQRLSTAPKFCNSCGQSFLRRHDEGAAAFRIRRTCGEPDCIAAAMRKSVALKLRPTKLYPIEFKAVRQRVLDRDTHQCQLCGNPGGLGKGSTNTGLHVHHINYVKDDLRIDNLVALCRSCHMKTNFNREHWMKYFAALILERDVA